MTKNLTKEGLPRPGEQEWRSYVEQWDRSLRAANRPWTTRYNYQLAVTQLADFLAGDDLISFLEETGMDPDDDSDAAQDPADVSRKHVEWFIGWMIKTRSAATALNKYKALQQFFRYLLDEEEINRDPMARMSQPDPGEKLVPIVRDDEMEALFETCKGKSYLNRRDVAIIRLLFDTGARLSEISSLTVDDVDRQRDLITVTGKGDRQRSIPFGDNTGQALDRYFRVRNKHRGSDLPDLFLAERGRRPLNANGIKIMLRRRGKQAGIENMHAHRLRHTLSHQWQLRDGNETALMDIMGWRSPEMLRRYGKSAASERALHAHREMRLGNRL